MRLYAIAIISVMACAGPTPAHANPATISLQGNIPAACTSGNVGTVMLSSTIGSTGTLDPTLQDRTFVVPGWYCSAASTIRLTSTSLRLSTPRSSLKSTESQAVNFTSRATGWSPLEARVSTGDTSRLGTLTPYSGLARAQNAAKTGTIRLKVDDFIIVGTTAKTTPKLIPGSYSAQIVITLSPSQ